MHRPPPEEEDEEEEEKEEQEKEEETDIDRHRGTERYWQTQTDTVAYRRTLSYFETLR